MGNICRRVSPTYMTNSVSPRGAQTMTFIPSQYKVGGKGSTSVLRRNVRLLNNERSLKYSRFWPYIQGGPERMQHLRSIISRKRGRKWINCVMKAFWFYGRFSEAMSFSKFATSVSKVTIDVPQISIVWHPRVKCLLLLWNNEDSLNKEK